MTSISFILRNLKLRSAVFLALVLAFSTPVHSLPASVGHLQWLDKVTARISDFSLPVSESRRIGNLEVTLFHCDRTPPEEPPESTAFLQIVEHRPGEEPVLRFSGWMFASSPAIHGLEHPVYDIWLTGCGESPQNG